MSVESAPPIPKEIHADENEWQVVKHKNRRRERSPIPTSPPPLPPELAERIWHKPHTSYMPIMETAKTLRAVQEFNKTPTMANFRDKRVDRSEESHRDARAKIYERRRREPLLHEERRHKPPPPTSAVDHRQGVDQTTMQGLKPTFSAFQNKEMMSVAGQDAIFEQNGGKAQSVAKSIMQSMCSNNAYSAKALKKLKKLLASKSKKTQSVVSRNQRDAASGSGQ